MRNCILVIPIVLLFLLPFITAIIFFTITDMIDNKKNFIEAFVNFFL